MFELCLKLLCFLILSSTKSILVSLKTCDERAPGDGESVRRGAPLCPAGSHRHRRRHSNTHLEKCYQKTTKHQTCVSVLLMLLLLYLRVTQQRWTTLRWLTSCPPRCRTRRRFCLATCRRSTTSTRGAAARPFSTISCSASQTQHLTPNPRFANILAFICVSIFIFYKIYIISAL